MSRITISSYEGNERVITRQSTQLLPSIRHNKSNLVTIDIDRLWLRWVDAQGDWVLTDTEQARQETELALEQADQEHQLRKELLAKLRARGIDPDTL